MRTLLHVRGFAALMGLTLLGALSITGCGDQDQRQSGTAVQDTPEAQAGRKASMEGMQSIMQKQNKAPSPK